MLVVGAMAVIRYAERNGTRRPWLVQLMARRTTKVAAVALANKTARMVWAIMTSGERYREPSHRIERDRRAIADEVGKGRQEVMRQSRLIPRSRRTQLGQCTSSACF